MKTKSKTSLDIQLARLVGDARDYATGKTAVKTTLVTGDGSRATLWERLPEAKRRRARQERFKMLRADLGLTQIRMAEALRVSANTLKGWEAGKPIPEVAFVLAELLHDLPAVRKRLLAA